MPPRWGTSMVCVLGMMKIVLVMLYQMDQDSLGLSISYMLAVSDGFAWSRLVHYLVVAATRAGLVGNEGLV
jgi:hypothetical protein